MFRFLTFSLLLFVLPFTAFSQMDLPPNGFNPRATISEEVGITSITIEYSRPGVKGREGNIWGEVVGDGFGNYSFVTASMDSPWRAGANKATIIEFEHDVKVEGKDLPAGKYALFLAMGMEKTTVIFSRQIEAWGSFNYEEADDALRVEVQPVQLKESVEWLKYEFIDHEQDACTIAMQWEKRSVPFRIEVDLHTIVLERIHEEFKGVKSFISANRIHAAMYCFEHNINLEEAVTWVEQGVSGEPFGQTGFSNYEFLATGYEKLDRPEAADSVLLVGLQIATLYEFTINFNRLIELGRSQTALAAMELAQVKFGDIYEVNEGLFRAHSALGNQKKALGFARKALKQAPSEEIGSELQAVIQQLQAVK